MVEPEARALRADATRNRNQLLDVATRVFAAAGTEPSMRTIAREAGVGIATLYRHFPTRESLVDAVYRDQVTRLTDGARELLAHLSPPAALRRWMELFGDWIATKNGMLDTLLTMIESGEIAHAQTRTELLAAIDTILDAGRATGELRADVTAEDIAANLIGIFTVAHPPGHDARARHLLNILMDGLRPAAPPSPARADDRAAIAGIVRTFFAAFTSGADCAPRLDALRQAFLPEAVIVRTGGDAPAVYGVNDFIAPRQELLTNGTLTDFREWELAGHTEISGAIAQHFCSYAKAGVQEGAAFTGRGKKTLQFVRTPAGWRISAVAWDDETTLAPLD